MKATLFKLLKSLSLAIKISSKKEPKSSFLCAYKEKAIVLETVETTQI